MEQLIQIKHRCGALLALKLVPGIEKKNITCPVCHKTEPFSEYKVCGGAAGVGGPDKEETDMDENTELALAHLDVINGAMRSRYDLKEGRNVIGRMSSSSAGVDLAIDTGSNKHISRKHLIIDVVVNANGPVFKVSLSKKEVNNTYVNNELMLYGDCIYLKPGSCIQLPDGVKLQFVLDYKGGGANKDSNNAPRGTEYSEYN